MCIRDRSVEAQMEARQLMLAPNNIFSPASGKPIATPTQDIIPVSYTHLDVYKRQTLAKCVKTGPDSTTGSLSELRPEN